MDMTRFRLMLLQGAADPHFAACYHKKDSEAPDYAPMQQASEYSAALANQLSRDQMAQAQAQYEQNMAVAKPVIDAQLAMMNQQLAQGKDYYDYMVANQRPLEEAMNREVMGYNPKQDQLERNLITGANADVYAARKADIDEQVGNALSDIRTGQTNTTNQMIRQAARYGWSPEKLAAMAGSQGIGMASAQAAAVNGARNSGIANTRNLLMQNRQMRQGDEAREWGKKMDVAGLYRNLTGASQGAYGLAMGAGNAAAQNQMAPSNALLAQNQGAMGTAMQGQQLKLSGLGSVLNAQANVYNSGQGASNPLMGMAGAAMGGWASGGFKSPFG